jgi:hypothetical protein
MDEHIRRLERRAAAGDYTARQQWRVAVMRAGYPDPDDAGPLTEWEEIQKDYDKIWWHGKPSHCWWWGEIPIGGLVKAHHTWGHRGWNPNSKRKTLRTHRDGSRKNYKIKCSHSEETVEESDRARRRKKRFGGKEHRKHEWSYNQETKRYKSWTTITKPCLDE